MPTDRSIFVDSWAWLALANRRDSWHQAAARGYERIKADDWLLEGYGTPRICGQGSRGVLTGARQVARPLVGERQGYAGVGVARSELEAYS